MNRNKCTVCKRGSKPLVLCPTILHSMGYIGSSYAHEKCVFRVQQKALTFKEKLR